MITLETLQKVTDNLYVRLAYCHVAGGQQLEHLIKYGILLLLSKR